MHFHTKGVLGKRVQSYSHKCKRTRGPPAGQCVSLTHPLALGFSPCKVTEPITDATSKTYMHPCYFVTEPQEGDTMWLQATVVLVGPFQLYIFIAYAYTEIEDFWEPFFNYMKLILPDFIFNNQKFRVIKSADFSVFSTFFNATADLSTYCIQQKSADI